MYSLRSPVNEPANLYKQDFFLWLEITARLLKERRFSDIDITNLIEEIESMGRSEKHGLQSNLVVVLLHLLKYKYQPEKRSKSWLSSILEHRRRLRVCFEDSPSLKPYFTEVFERCYQDARHQAAVETGLPLDRFPEESPFTPQETLISEFLPD
jgi:hypothetical protein